LNIQEIGVIGDLIGALATVVTLAYLAVQIRRNTNATRAATYDAISAGWRQHQRESFIAHPDNVDLWARALSDFDALSAAQQRLFFYLGATEFHFVENLIEQRDRGHLAADEIETWLGYFASVVRTSGGTVCWNVNKQLFRNQKVVAEIDRRVKDSSGLPNLLQMLPQFDMRTRERAREDSL
jgi:hypothetical protein